jgi:predicted nucleic acid-binding protein
MGLVVFDSDVLIGCFNRDDAHHEAAVAIMEDLRGTQTKRCLCAVNYAEIMVGPMRSGTGDQVRAMLDGFGIEIQLVDTALAERAASVRVQTRLKLADAFVLATAAHAQHRGGEDVRVVSFDERVLKAYATQRP